MALSFLQNRSHTDYNFLVLYSAIAWGGFKPSQVDTTVDQANLFGIHSCLDQQLDNFSRYRDHSVDLLIVKIPGIPVVGLGVIHSSSHHVFWGLEAAS